MRAATTEESTPPDMATTTRVARGGLARPSELRPVKDSMAVKSGARAAPRHSMIRRAIHPPRRCIGNSCRDAGISRRAGAAHGAGRMRQVIERIAVDVANLLAKVLLPLARSLPSPA